MSAPTPAGTVENPSPIVLALAEHRNPPLRHVGKFSECIEGPCVYYGVGERIDLEWIEGPVRWYNDPRAICAYILRGGTCSTGVGCGSRGEPSCVTDAPGGPFAGSHGWPYRNREMGGFVYPGPVR